MKKVFISFACAFSLSAFAQQSRVLDPTDNMDYRAEAKGAKWIVEVESTSKYSNDGIPLSLSSQVKIEENRSGKTKITKVAIPHYPNEGGVIFIEVESVSTPLFLVLSKGGDLPDDQREIQLVAPNCARALASVTAVIEDASQIQINTGVKDFMISFPGPRGSMKKTWTAPADSSKLCQQRW